MLPRRRRVCKREGGRRMAGVLLECPLLPRLLSWEVFYTAFPVGNLCGAISSSMLCVLNAREPTHGQTRHRVRVYHDRNMDGSSGGSDLKSSSATAGVAAIVLRRHRHCHTPTQACCTPKREPSFLTLFRPSNASHFTMYLSLRHSTLSVV